VGWHHVFVDRHGVLGSGRRLLKNVEAWRTSYNLISGSSAGVDFRVSTTNSYLYLMLEHDREGPHHSRWAVIAHDGMLSAQYRADGGEWYHQWGLLNPLKTNTWYRLRLRIDEVNGFKIEVRERDGCPATNTACGATFSAFLPKGESWRFGTAIQHGDPAWRRVAG
jgi:hypothetical protein